MLAYLYWFALGCLAGQVDWLADFRDEAPGDE